MINTLRWEVDKTTTINVTDWSCESPRAVVLLIHGLGEHARRFEHVAAAFNASGIAVVGIDLRGHGLTEGLRGHIVSYEHLMDDMDFFLKKTKALYKKTPVFIYGHSMGGNIVLSYVLRRNPKINAVLTTSAWIVLGFQPPAIKVFLGKAVRKLYPTFSQSNSLDTKSISRIPLEVKAYEDDPLVHNKITAATGADILAAADVLRDNKDAFPCPLLMSHGTEDGLISYKGSEIFYENHKSNTKDITLKLWEGGYHELHNDLCKSEMIAYQLEWILKHL
jgi:alpha-beta hydrolase superfamily lysophospholipase